MTCLGSHLCIWKKGIYLWSVGVYFQLYVSKWHIPVWRSGLHTDGFCLMYQQRDLRLIEQNLKIFSYACDWFVTKNLSIYFGGSQDQKYIVWHKKETKKDSNLDIRYCKIKVTYLFFIEDQSSIIDSDVCLKKIDFYPNLCSTTSAMCNAIVKPHFHHVYSAWCPNLNKSLKTKL